MGYLFLIVMLTVPVSAVVLAVKGNRTRAPAQLRAAYGLALLGGLLWVWPADFYSSLQPGRDFVLLIPLAFGLGLSSFCFSRSASRSRRSFLLMTGLYLYFHTMLIIMIPDSSWQKMEVGRLMSELVGREPGHIMQGDDAERLMPVLTQALSDKNRYRRRAAAKLLAQAAPRSEPARSALKTAALDSDSEVQKIAGDALRQADKQ